MNREKVYNIINEERDYQVETAKKWNHKGNPSLAEELLMIDEYIQQAKSAWTSSPDEERVRDRLRVVAALCVRTFENYGIPHRK